MNTIVGGEGASCGCACYYAGTPGGSSTVDNGIANWEGGLQSPKGEIDFEICCPPQP